MRKHPLSSLDLEESLAWQITSPFNNKLGCFLKQNYKDCLTEYFVACGSYLASQ